MIGPENRDSVSDFVRSQIGDGGPRRSGQWNTAQESTKANDSQGSTKTSNEPSKPSKQTQETKRPGTTYSAQSSQDRSEGQLDDEWSSSGSESTIRPVKRIAHDSVADISLTSIDLGPAFEGDVFFSKERNLLEEAAVSPRATVTVTRSTVGEPETLTGRVNPIYAGITTLDPAASSPNLDSVASSVYYSAVGSPTLAPDALSPTLISAATSSTLVPAATSSTLVPAATSSTLGPAASSEHRSTVESVSSDGDESLVPSYYLDPLESPILRGRTPERIPAIRGRPNVVDIQPRRRSIPRISPDRHYLAPPDFRAPTPGSIASISSLPPGVRSANDYIPRAHHARPSRPSNLHHELRIPPVDKEALSRICPEWIEEQKRKAARQAALEPYLARRREIAAFTPWQRFVYEMECKPCWEEPEACCYIVDPADHDGTKYPRGMSMCGFCGCQKWCCDNGLSLICGADTCCEGGGCVRCFGWTHGFWQCMSRVPERWEDGKRKWSAWTKGKGEDGGSGS